MFRRIVLFLAVGACGPTATHIDLDPDEVRLTAKGATATIAAKGTDDYMKEASVEGLVWTSADPAVATVDDKGTVTAVSSGTTSVTATLGEVAAASQVIVDIFGTGTVNVAPWILPGEYSDISFSLTNEKGEKFTAGTPVCTSSAPDVVAVDGSRATANKSGVAKINCTMDTHTFDTTVSVIAPEMKDLAHGPATIAADYKWTRDSIGLAKEVKAIGLDKIKLTRFEIRRGKQPFAYEFCGSSEEIKMTLRGDAGPIALAITGPCGAAFDDAKPPWDGAPWMPMLVEFTSRGLPLAKDEAIVVVASKPDEWVMKGGGKTHLVSKGGVIQP